MIHIANVYIIFLPDFIIHMYLLKLNVLLAIDKNVKCQSFKEFINIFI